MRKLFLLLILACFIVIGACTPSQTVMNKEKNSNTGEDAMEITIEDVYYIFSTKEDKYDPDGHKGIVKIDMKVKNISDESLDIYPNRDMRLYDDEDQLDPKDFIDSSIDLRNQSQPIVDTGKKKSFSVLFEMEDNKQYELYIEPKSISRSEKVNPVTIDIDMNDYADSYSALNEPVEILEQYIRAIYFDEENDELEDLMAIDIAEEKERVEASFDDFIETVSFKKTPVDSVAKYYDTFKKTMKDKGSFDVSLLGNSREKAVIALDYEAISAETVMQEILKIRNQYYEENSSDSKEDATDYALSQLDDVIKEVELKSGRLNSNIEMIKKDGKWNLESRGNIAKEHLDNIFIKGKAF